MFKSMLASAATFNPDVFMVGGDIAYDNGMCTCYYAWDFYLDIITDFYNQVGRLVPLVFAVGNHDAGADDAITP